MNDMRPSPSKNIFFSHVSMVAKLAIADIWHERRMSLCMMLAVAAIATPLLLFFGLKSGTVETMRSRLLGNPVNLEIIPNTEKLLDADWFEKMRSDPRVGFVVPHTRKLSAQVDVESFGAKGRTFRLDARPTSEGDILLSRYNTPIPRSGECILTAKAARLLNLEPGKDAVFTAMRDMGRLRGTHTFRVVGVLPPQASPLASTYISLNDLENIENFKDGRAVPEWKWSGAAPFAHPEFLQVLLLAEQKLDSEKKVLLTENTGFASLKEYDLKEATISLPPNMISPNAYMLSSLGAMAAADNIDAAKHRLYGIKYRMIPLPRDLTLELVQSGQAFEIAPATALDEDLLGYALPSTCEPKDWASLDVHPTPRIFIVSQKNFEQLGSQEIAVRISATIGENRRTIEFPARFIASPYVEEGLALAPLSLIGTMNLLHQRSLEFRSTDANSGNKDFALGRRGYSGFRMYASDLESVASLAKTLEDMGIKAVTRADRIAEIKQLDMSLSLLFWVIALASMSGAIACLTANMYATVERKRRELAVLRLLGLHGLPLSFFPFVTVSGLCCGGLTFAILLFHGMSVLINQLFSEHLMQGEAFCSLSYADQGYAIAAGLAVALLAGLGACRRMASLQPSESLRDE